MSEQKRLEDLFTQPSVPKDLQTRLLHNLEEQVAAERAHGKLRHWRIGLAFSLAANILLAVLLAFPRAQTPVPSLLDMAHAHVQHEQELSGHFVANDSDWLARQGIRLPAQSYNVALTKKCLIGMHQASHIRLSTAEHSTFDLIIFAKSSLQDLPQAVAGKLGVHRWLKFEPRSEILIFAFFPPQISDADVQYLIHHMFQDASAKSTLL